MNQEKQLPARGLKQVKVDNWASFFLQRLLQLYLDEIMLDLTIKFPTSEMTVKAHRLVVTTCTNYFTQLEHQQKEKDSNFDGTIIMPPDMPYECIKSIINFMYTGQLEYWTSEQSALYRTAEKMNMTVLTKLLEAQFNTNPSQLTEKSNQSIIPPPKSSSRKSFENLNSLPAQPLPGRKLPIWKRKLDNQPVSSYANYNKGSSHRTYIDYKKSNTQSTSGPSRFDLPEAEDLTLGVLTSFDDITYHTKPIVQAPEKSNIGNTSNVISSNDNSNAKRFAKFHDSSEHQEYSLMDDGSQDQHNDSSDDGDDWVGLKSILRQQENHPPSAKRVHFNFDEKENVNKSENIVNPNVASGSVVDSVGNHAKIIREVLKKYPHLVKNNKNIRLKIMQKDVKSPEQGVPSKTTVSYVVLKSDHLKTDGTSSNESNNGSNGAGGRDAADCENGPWKCHKCDLVEEYTNYYLYRRHMQDVHDERFDPRICEHCGYKATKRNILMYHLYMKHNVPPPKSMSFPKCHACSYVALSESLLIRHQINQKHRPPVSRPKKLTTEGVQCEQCNQTFKDIVDLTDHKLNTGHGTGSDKNHRCPHCGKHFVRLTNLRVHLESAHINELTSDVSMEFVENASVPLEPSSEAEALVQMASGIATSLGINDPLPSDQQDANELQTHEFEVPQGDDNLYNGDDVSGEHQMIMLIDSDIDYQQQVYNEQKNQQLSMSCDGQLIMQGTEEGMIVYIQNSEIPTDSNVVTVEAVHNIDTHNTEEIVEEVVEEVEEFEEYYENQESTHHELDSQKQNAEECSQRIENEFNSENEVVMREDQSLLLEDGTVEQVEEVIQYIEEETEIVEYDEEHCVEDNNES